MVLTGAIVIPALVALLLAAIETHDAKTFPACNQACNLPPPYTPADKNRNCYNCCSNQMKTQFVTGKCTSCQGWNCFGGGKKGTLSCSCESGFKVPRFGSICLKEQNDARRQYGKRALTYNSKLASAAKAHNDAMISTGVVSHDCPREPPLDQRAIKVGYSFSVVAENIAAGPPSCPEAVKSWLNSKDGHRENLLGQFAEVGCAVVMPRTGMYKIFWTCVYANPKKKP